MKTHVAILLLGCLLTGCQQQFEDTTPIRKDVTEAVFASGKLVASGTYSLIAKSDGYLVAMGFDAGDIVQQGDVLAVIENQETRVSSRGNEELFALAKSNTEEEAPALIQADVAIDMAREQLAQDSLQAARYEKLWQQNSVALVDVERAQLTERNARKNLESALETYRQLEREAEQKLINSRINYEVSNESLKQVQIKAVVGGVPVYNQVHLWIADAATQQQRQQWLGCVFIEADNPINTSQTGQHTAAAFDRNDRAAFALQTGH